MLDYVCPQCRGPVSHTGESVSPEYHCPACPRSFPIRFGIPDFRLRPDPYISFDDELAKAGQLVEAAKTRPFEELVRYYWQITSDVPASAAERYVKHVISGEERGRDMLESIQSSGDAHLSADAAGVEAAALLETGCGTGGFLLAAARSGHRVVGVDIALRWLVIADHRLKCEGVFAQLVCASADRLPFADDTFEIVTNAHALEHMENAPGAISETARVLDAGGRLHFVTPNRFSLGPEPCVRLWGVGFLPRPFMAPYVRLVRGVPYRFIRLLSALDLRRMLRQSRLSSYEVAPSPLSKCEIDTLGPSARRLAAAYNRLLARPTFSRVMELFGPLLLVTGQNSAPD